jgi:hypothetical protein
MVILFRSALLAVLLGWSVPALASDKLKDIEPRFRRTIADCSVVEGGTDEQSCGGTWMKVYTKGGQVRLIRWNIETSRYFVTRHFYFTRDYLQFVTERVFDKTGVQKSYRRISPGGSAYYWTTNVDTWRSIKSHAMRLKADFLANRGAFTSVVAKAGP